MGVRMGVKIVRGAQTWMKVGSSMCSRIRRRRVFSVISVFLGVARVILGPSRAGDGCNISTSSDTSDTSDTRNTSTISSNIGICPHTRLKTKATISVDKAKEDWYSIVVQRIGPEDIGYRI